MKINIEIQSLCPQHKTLLRIIRERSSKRYRKTEKITEKELQARKNRNRVIGPNKIHKNLAESKRDI